MIDAKHVLDLHRANISVRRIAGMSNATEAEVLAVLGSVGAVPRRPRVPRNQTPVVVTKPARAKAKPVPKAEPKASQEPARPPVTPPRGRFNPVKAALQILGTRARETGDGYAVDGRPVGSFELIRKANAVLKADGMPQMDACEEWVVTD